MKAPAGNHETVTTTANGEGKFIRKSKILGQYGHVVVKIEPNGRSKGIVIVSEIVDDAIPQEFIKPAKDGVFEGLANGVVAGFPVTDVIVRLVNGSFHPAHSSELAFKMAGIFAVKDAMKKALPILIENPSGPPGPTAPNRGGSA